MGASDLSDRFSALMACPVSAWVTISSPYLMNGVAMGDLPAGVLSIYTSGCPTAWRRKDLVRPTTVPLQPKYQTQRLYTSVAGRRANFFLLCRIDRQLITNPDLKLTKLRRIFRW